MSDATEVISLCRDHVVLGGFLALNFPYTGMFKKEVRSLFHTVFEHTHFTA